MKKLILLITCAVIAYSPIVSQSYDVSSIIVNSIKESNSNHSVVEPILYSGKDLSRSVYAEAESFSRTTV